MAGRKKIDPLDQLGKEIAADHTTAKNMGDKIAAGAIDGAAAVAENGGDADQTVAGAIGGAAAAASAQQNPDVTSGVVDTTATDTPPEIETEEEVEDAAWTARLERLERIVDEADFEGSTAVGDIRDCLRELFKTRDKPWHLLDANMRKDLDNHLTKVAQLVLRKVVLVVAEEDFETLQGTMLENFNVKGETLEVKLKLEHVDSEVLLSAYKLAGKRVVVINASDHKFGGARRPNDPGERQEDLVFSDSPAIAENKPAEPAPAPSDDSDLAGEGTKPEGAAETEEHDPDAVEWIVYDDGAKVWLADVSEDDPWTEEVEKAMRMTLQEAKDECVSHGEGMIVQRAQAPDETEGEAAE